MRHRIIACLLLLGACTAGADRRAFLDTLVGQPETAVIRQLGVPSRTFQTPGHRFLAYDEQRSSALYGGGGPFFVAGAFYNGRFGYADSFPAEIVQRRCETTFEVVNDRVVTYALRGNACG